MSAHTSTGTGATVNDAGSGRRRSSEDLVDDAGLFPRPAPDGRRPGPAPGRRWPGNTRCSPTGSCARPAAWVSCGPHLTFPVVGSGSSWTPGLDGGWPSSWPSCGSRRCGPPEAIGCTPSWADARVHWGSWRPSTSPVLWKVASQRRATAARRGRPAPRGPPRSVAAAPGAELFPSPGAGRPHAHCVGPGCRTRRPPVSTGRCGASTARGRDRHGFLNLPGGLRGGGGAGTRCRCWRDRRRRAVRLARDVPGNAKRARSLLVAYGSCSTASPGRSRPPSVWSPRRGRALGPGPPVPERSTRASTRGERLMSSGLANLPFGVFSHPRPADRAADRGGGRRPRARPGPRPRRRVFASPPSTPFLARGRPFGARPGPGSPSCSPTGTDRGQVSRIWCPLGQVVLHRPFTVADYVDFYCSLDHASNVGRMFRPDAEPLLPNWRHLPVGYHGRAGTVVGLGHPGRAALRAAAAVGGGRRRSGRRAASTSRPRSGFVVGVGSALGEPVPRRGLRRPRLRGGAGQRLERPRHPGLGVPAARPVPRQVVRHVDLAVGRAAGGAGGGPGRRAGAGPGAAAVPAAGRALGRSTWPSRWRSTVRWSPGPRSPPCTGRRTRCWPT